MVLTDRQRADLHSGIFEYLQSRPGEAFQKAAAFLQEADPDACNNTSSSGASTGTVGSDSSSPANGANKYKTPLLEKKWTAIPRLQKKVLELERAVAQSAKIHAHRTQTGTGGADGLATERRMLPRLPETHKLQGHSLVVTSVALHPVFTVVVSGSEDGTIKVWDHESGEYIRTCKGHTNTVNSVCFTPKGTHLASCSTDLSIKLWDVTTWTCLRTLRGHDHTISAVSFVPLDKSTLNSPDGSSSPTSTLIGGSGSTSNTTGLDAAAAGAKHLLSGSRDQTVKLWDIETGFCDQTFCDHTDWVRCLAVRASDGGNWASSGNDHVIYVYDTRNNHSLAVELRGHDHVVEALAFITEEGLKTNNRPKKHDEMTRDYLASGSRDRTVRLWRISEASCIATFSAHENWVRGVKIHPSGNYILSCSDDKTIRVFDIKANRCLRTLDKAHDHFVTAIDMHHTLPILVSGGVDQTVRCWLLE